MNWEHNWQKKLANINETSEWREKFKIISCYGHYHVVNRLTGLSCHKRFSSMADAANDAGLKFSTGIIEEIILKP